jgi:hypothetical protein
LQRRKPGETQRAEDEQPRHDRIAGHRRLAYFPSVCCS